MPHLITQLEARTSLNSKITHKIQIVLLCLIFISVELDFLILEIFILRYFTLTHLFDVLFPMPHFFI